MSRYLETNN